MANGTLQDRIIQELQDLYDTVHHLTRALDEMAQASASQEIKDVLERHLSQTRNDIERLECVFNLLKERTVQNTRHLKQEEQTELSSIEEPEEGFVWSAALISPAKAVYVNDWAFVPAIGY